MISAVDICDLCCDWREDDGVLCGSHEDTRTMTVFTGEVVPSALHGRPMPEMLTFELCPKHYVEYAEKLRKFITERVDARKDFP